VELVTFDWERLCQLNLQTLVLVQQRGLASRESRGR
jgi:hypothetical protein